MTADFQNPIRIKNKQFIDYINKKDITLKIETYVKHKKYRNILSAIIRKRKELK